MKGGVSFRRAYMQAGCKAFFFAYKNLQRSVRDDRWKLIRYPQVDRTQLFDLKSDPDEMRNLADANHAAKVAELTTMLESEMHTFGDAAKLTVANPKSGEWSRPKGKKKAGP